MAKPDLLLEQARKETLAILEGASGYFINLLFIGDNLFYYFWTETPEMPSSRVPNKSLLRKIEAWQEMTSVSKRHEVERFDTKREMCERLFQLSLNLLPSANRNLVRFKHL